MAELRPTRGDYLTADALAPLLGASARTAQRRIERWLEQQATNARVPRVLRVSTGGRPAHVVDRASFEAWRRMGWPSMTAVL